MMRCIYDYCGNADYLAHHGIKGQKWGVRRFQNSDGTWTDAGKMRYNDGNGASNVKKSNGLSDQTKARLKTAAKVGAAVAVTAVAAYGIHKLNKVAVNQLKNEDISKGLEYLKAQDKVLSDRVRVTDSLRNNIKNAANATNDIERRQYKARADYDYRLGNELAAYNRDVVQKKNYHFDRANSGNYSIREKADAIRRLKNRR